MQSAFRCLLLAAIAIAMTGSLAGGQGFGFDKRAPVRAETRLDWAYVVRGRSFAEPPTDLLPDYQSKRQGYVLYGPRQVDASRKYPLILFISFRSTSFGWTYCRQTCARHGVIFAEPLKAGNRVPTTRRVRIILDVLDDVRRRFPIDPDRTYLMGHSGGAAMAELISRSLPEYFGGTMLSSGHAPIPQHPWLAQRMKERLSLSIHAGQNEKTVALDLQHVTGPLLQQLGVRTQFHIHPGVGHVMVPPATIEQAYRWLEAGLDQRREMAEQIATAREEGNPTPEEWAAVMLAEAKQRLETDDQLIVGLEQLDSIWKRWPHLEEGRQAKQLFDDYQSREHRPWVEQARQSRLSLTQELAQRYEGLAMGRVGLSKVRRAGFARGAISNWKIILRETDDEAKIERAQENMSVLEKIVELDPSRPSTRGK